MPNYSNSLSAFSANDVVVQASANNIANINTNGYKAINVELESGSNDQGVSVGRISRDTSSGPAVISDLSFTQSASVENATEQQLQDKVNASFITDSQQAAKNSFYSIESHERDFGEASNVELPNETTTLMVSQNAYSANAAAIRAYEEVDGALLSMMV